MVEYDARAEKTIFASKDRGVQWLKWGTNAVAVTGLGRSDSHQDEAELDLPDLLELAQSLMQESAYRSDVEDMMENLKTYYRPRLDACLDSLEVCSFLSSRSDLMAFCKEQIDRLVKFQEDLPLALKEFEDISSEDGKNIFFQKLLSMVTEADAFMGELDKTLEAFKGFFKALLERSKGEKAANTANEAESNPE